MATVSGEEAWESCAGHVKEMFQRASDEIQMYHFIDSMIKHLQQRGYSHETMNHVKRSMIQSMVAEINSRDRNHKKIYDPEADEECLVAKRKDMIQIERFIKNRNTHLVNPVLYRLIK